MEASAEEPVLIADRYQLMRTLGQGGMATVYGVVDRSTGRVLALKQLSSEVASKISATQTLFKREYHTLSQLKHPCIVRAYDYGVDIGGPFYTMELLDGEDLRAMSAQPWRRACELLREVASGLSLLHSRRLLHRDVNYKNVRCTAGGRAKLLDFGTLATFGMQADVAGMAPFVAPEALRGQALDPRVDLYSLGCLAYWLLSGKHAYDAQTNDELEALWSHAPARLSELTELPEALEALVTALMSLDPLARPSSAGEVIHRLSAIAELNPQGVPAAIQSSLVSPRLVGRTREIERIRRMLRSTLERVPSERPQSAATGRLKPIAQPACGSAPPDDDLRATTELGHKRVRSRATSDLGPPAGRTPPHEGRLVISGPPGCGRSRLLSELVVEAKLSGATVLSASASRSREQPFGVARQLLRALRAQCPDLFESLDSVQLDLVEAPSLLPPPPRNPLSAPQQTLQAERRARVASLVEMLLTRAAQQRPVVIAVDDLHLCDGHSAGLLAGLSETTPIVVAHALCSGVTPRASDAVASIEQRALQIELQPFDREATDALVHSLFGQVPHARLLSEWIYDSSRGNPLSCMELVQYLIDRDSIRYQDGAWLLPSDPAEHGLPEGVRYAMLEQLARLSRNARTMLGLLALHDKPLSLQDWVELTDHEDQTVFAAVDELVAAGIVLSDGASYWIAREPLAETVVAEMLDERRKSGHARIGQLLKKRRSPKPADMVKTAYHLMQAGELDSAARLVFLLARSNMSFVTAAGPAAAPVVEHALELFERSGRSPGECLHLKLALVAHGAEHDPSYARYADGVLHQLSYDCGLARFAELDPVMPAEKRLALAFEHAKARYDATPPGQRGLPQDVALACLSTCVLHLVRFHAVRYDIRAFDRLASTVEPYRDLGIPLAHAIYDMVHGVQCLLRGKLPKAQEHYGRVLSILDAYIDEHGADESIQMWRCEAWASLGVRLSYASDSALQFAERIEASGFELCGYEAVVIRMLRHYFRGEQLHAEALADRLERLLIQRRSGWHHGGWFNTYKALACFRVGDVLGAKQATDHLSAIAHRFPGYRKLADTAHGQHLALQGELSGAERVFDKLLATTQAGEIAVWSHATLSQLSVLKSMGRYGDARSLAARSLEAARLGGLAEADREDIRRELLLSQAYQGQAQRAARALDDMITAPVNEGPLAGWALHTARAEVAALIGDERAFARHTTQAEKLARSTESPMLIARHQQWRQQF